MTTNNEINDKASVLGRMLTHFQLSVGQEVPLAVIEGHVQLVHKVSGELVELLRAADPSTVVRFSTELSAESADLLAERYGDDTPDTIPDDWSNPT